MFVLLLLSIPLSIIWFNTEHILVLVHQDKSISSVAGSYARYMIPSLFAYGLLQCINRFLQAQNNVFPVFVCSGITTCLHLLLCWLFVLKTGLGYRGAALAISVSYCWTGFFKEAFQDIYDFSKIAFPSAVMVCLELWSFELLVLASGLLPNPVVETSVLSICLNTSLTIWQISVGLGGAARKCIPRDISTTTSSGYSDDNFLGIFRRIHFLGISRRIHFLGIFRRQRFLEIFRQPKFVGIFRYFFSLGMFPRTVPSEISEEIPTNSFRKCFFGMSLEFLILASNGNNQSQRTNFVWLRTELGIQMQRAMFVLLLLSIPLSIIWFNTEHILVLVHQDKSISSVAGSYARYMIPSLFAYGLLQCINRFLQAQNNVFPVFVCSGITTCLHLLLCWLFVLKTGLGYRGAALAISVSYCWTGFFKEAFQDIYDFSKIAFPSAVMVCLELWSFELLVLASGLLPNPVVETSVLSICLNTSLTIWQISVGLGGAASIRVSNELGAGNPQVAKLAVYVIVGIAVAQGIVVVTVLLSVRKVLGRAFSSDPKIIYYAASMIPIVACGNFLDGLQCVLSGVARGCGWQKIGACVNLGSYYLVGVPLGLLLGFHFHIGGRGLWLGIVTALAVQVLCLSLVTIFTNWDKEAKKATKRVGSSDD
uniref:Protein DETOXIFICATION n=2 Tax=Brassica TaxID=3705 RepID=A0A0D3CWU5_BRAOL